MFFQVFLILFVCSLAIKSWNFRDNYRESKYIGILMVVTVPVWLAWIMSAIVLHDSFHPACLGKLVVKRPRLSILI
jgi:7 transmembrane sweet-taste receptor of 3 GCPR